MTQFNLPSLMRWALRSIGLLVIAFQWVYFLSIQWNMFQPHHSTRFGLMVESVTRMLIIAGFFFSLRFPRIGGAAMVAGASVLSIAVYSWAGALGSAGSMLLALHILPPIALGLLLFLAPIDLDQREVVVAPQQS